MRTGAQSRSKTVLSWAGHRAGMAMGDASALVVYGSGWSVRTHVTKPLSSAIASSRRLFRT